MGMDMTKAQQTELVKNGKGFIAALDQSGGSTPKALRLYGVPETAYSGEAEMYDMIHAMRSRIIAFTASRSSARRSASRSSGLVAARSRLIEAILIDIRAAAP